MKKKIIMPKRKCKRSGSIHKISKQKISAVMDEVVEWYSHMYWSSVTWRFWVENAQKVFDGKMSLREFRLLMPPEPKESEVDYGSWKI